jgi:hypothetical protein
VRKVLIPQKNILSVVHSDQHEIEIRNWLVSSAWLAIRQAYKVYGDNQVKIDVIKEDNGQ